MSDKPNKSHPWRRYKNESDEQREERLKDKKKRDRKKNQREARKSR